MGISALLFVMGLSSQPALAAFDLAKCLAGESKICGSVLTAYHGNYPEFEKAFRMVCAEPKAGVRCEEIKVKDSKEADSVGMAKVRKDPNASYAYFNRENPTTVFFMTIAK